MMKQFSRRNSQCRHSGAQSCRNTEAFVLGCSQDTRISGLFCSADDPYDFPNDSQETTHVPSVKQEAQPPGQQHTAAATQPPIITAARNGGVAQVAPAAAARDFSREPTTTANPACSDGSPTKRARTDPDKHFAAKVAGIKRIASEPTKVAPKPVGGLIARAASDLAGATAGKGQSGRSGASRGSGQPARSHLARADSGSSRAASGGIKRSKSSSLTVIDLTSSAGSQGAAGAGCNPTHHQQQKQVSIAPVSLPTPRRPTRLGVIPVRLSEAAAEGRPAQTVMEAQERGELVQMQDDARYAMDGLVLSCSLETQRDSAVALTEVLCSRKGRLALRADGLTQQVLSSFAKLKPAKDSVLALAATVVLLMLTSEDAHPTYLASVAAAVLFDQLLQGNRTFDEATDSCAQGAKLVRVLKTRPLCTVLTSTGVTGQRELLLIALEQATSSQQSSKVAAVERLKQHMRQYGALIRLAKLVAEVAVDPVPAAKQLRLLLLVLENATFTCQANGQALVQLQLPGTPLGSQLDTSHPLDSQQQEQLLGPPQASFPVLLVQLANQLLVEGDREDCQQTLHVCFSVLMNLSHQNPDGAAVIAAAGGMQAAAAMIGQLLGPAQDSHHHLCKQVLQHLELISVALGVLINLVSGEATNSKLLANIAASSDSFGSQDTTVDDNSSLVCLLCKVMAAVGDLLQQAAVDEEMQDAAVKGNADPGSRASARRSSTASGGSALDENSAGEASIVEAYCAMLLGFMVRDSSEVAQCVPHMLEGQSLQPIVDAVQRCLNFYISTGAITDHTRNTLDELLRHLNKYV